MEICPIKNCRQTFLNKYSLNNHLQRNIELNHVDYYQKNVKKKICPDCNKKIDNRRKLYDGLCYSCFKNKSVSKVSKKIPPTMIKKVCFNCKTDLVGLFSKMNTRVLCPTCKKISVENKIKKKKNYDRIRYDINIMNRDFQRLKNKEEKINNLYNLLKNDLLHTEIPIYKLCKKYHISLLSIREVLPLLMSNSDYTKRNHNIRSKAIMARIDDIKNYLKNRPDPRNIKRVPSCLEKKIGDQIKGKFIDAEIRYNIWKSLKDEINNCYIHLESDVIVNFGDLRIIILCDGEVFHGKNSYFEGDTVEKDEWKSRLLHTINPFVIRYSETEIKKNNAINHLLVILQDIKDKKLSKYYRNWMLNIEEKTEGHNFFLKKETICSPQK
jgi:uncharacterized Zn finger protein (UPF0148 family)